MKFELIISIVFGFLPGIVWLVYFYKKDSVEPEPTKKIIKAFILGVFIAFPAGIFNSIFINTYNVFNLNERFYGSVLIAPLVEESLKYTVVVWAFYKDKNFDEPMDGIIYAVSVALGFAAIENLGYVYNSFATNTTVFTVAIRAFLTVPAHALFASVYGFGLGLKKFNYKRPFFVTTLLFGILLHAIFNFLASLNYAMGFIILGLMFFMWRRFSRNVLSALKISPHLKSKQT